MILTLKSKAELEASRRELAARELDFSDPGRARFWRLAVSREVSRPFPPADLMKSWDVARSIQIIEANVPDRRPPCSTWDVTTPRSCMRFTPWGIATSTAAT